MLIWLLVTYSFEMMKGEVFSNTEDYQVTTYGFK